MTTRLIIGRVGLDIELPALQAWTNTDESVSLSAANIALGFEEGKALIQQIIGLSKNPDEPIVPVIHGPDPSQWGCYRVTGSSVTSEALFVTEGHLSFTVDLERVADFSGFAEIQSYGTERATIIELTDTTNRFWSAFPSSWKGWSSSTGTPTAVMPTSETNDGYDITTPGGDSVTVYVAEHEDLREAIISAGIPVDAFYDGAAFIKNAGFNIHGRKAVIDVDDWSLTNGIVTVGPPGTPGRLCSVQFKDGTVYDVELGYVTAGPAWNVIDLPTARSITPTRVAPEECSLRIAWADIAAAATPPTLTNVYLDLTLRRGGAGVYALFEAKGQSKAWGVGWLPSATFDDIDVDVVGNVEVTPDGDGICRLLISATAATLGNANGRLWVVDTERFDVFIGFSGGGATFPDADSAEWQQDQYFSSQTELQSVVAQ